jgi:polyribonucleotide nucleotidyltransferase
MTWQGCPSPVSYVSLRDELPMLVHFVFPNCLQIQQWLMSYDGLSQPEPLAITAAAAALMVSGDWGGKVIRTVAGSTVVLFRQKMTVSQPLICAGLCDISSPR